MLIVGYGGLCLLRFTHGGELDLGPRQGDVEDYDYPSEDSSEL